MSTQSPLRALAKSLEDEANALTVAAVTQQPGNEQLFFRRQREAAILDGVAERIRVALKESGPTPERLTDAEYDALASAVALAEMEWTDNRIDRADTLRVQAANRALKKIEDTMRPRRRQEVPQ